jgi:hypothetical protein
MIDPKKDLTWKTMKKHVRTDDVHGRDRLNFQNDSKGTKITTI